MFSRLFSKFHARRFAASTIAWVFLTVSSSLLAPHESCGAEGCKRLKLFLGMTKRQVIRCFGEPDSAEKDTSVDGCVRNSSGVCIQKFFPFVFFYKRESIYCRTDAYGGCKIYFGPDGTAFQYEGFFSTYIDLESDW